MLFEFDPARSAANKMKHRLDFVEAHAPWQDPSRLEIPARMSTEVRWQAVARYGGKTWSAFVTHRGEAIRIISVRRDFPRELLDAIDCEAARIGVTRQAFIKIRLADTLTKAR